VSHEVTKKVVGHKYHLIGNPNEHRPGLFYFFVGRTGSLRWTLSTNGCW